MVLWLAVAFPLVFAADMPWWATVLVEAVVAVALVPLGLLLWFDAKEREEDTKRLRRTGRPAVAEVVEVDHVDPGDDTGTVVELRLRISGDPANNLFTLRRL